MAALQQSYLPVLPFGDPLSSQVRGAVVRGMDEAIWLSHPYAHIYFHVFNDVMTQMVLADKLGIDPATPVIVDDSFGKFHRWTIFSSDRVLEKTTNHRARAFRSTPMPLPFHPATTAFLQDISE